MTDSIELVYGYLHRTLKQNTIQLEKLYEESEILDENIKILKNKLEQELIAENGYKQAVDILYDKSFINLEHKINTILAKVFPDCYYRVYITPETLRGSKVVYIEMQSGDIISIPSDFGGSFETVIGLAFRIIYILQTGYPFLILDETLRDISDTYTYQLLEFLKQLGNEFGIELTIITHNEKLGALGDIHYHVHNKAYNLT